MRMMSLLTAAPFLLVLGSSGCMSMMMGKMKSEMFVIRESGHGFEATVERIKKAVGTLEGWILVESYDNQERYRATGDIGRQVVIVACKPQVAVRMLGPDENKQMAGMIPLKIVVSRRGDGKTQVSWMNVEMMSQMFDGELREALQKAARQLSAQMDRQLGGT